MALPWLRILDAAIGAVDLVRSRRGRPVEAADPQQQLEIGARTIGGLETRLAGVVVAALKEAFDRDTKRLDLEREQLEAERRRAERALKLELLRQAGEREIGRMRQFTAIAAASWLGTLFFSSRIVAAGTGPRVLLGAAWLLLLVAMGASFAAQSSIARALEEERDHMRATGAAALAPWLVIGGLALVALAVLMG
jgi:hypothetical protein